MGDSSPIEPVVCDEDLYCLECGYNLRGQEGDPRRCPECGESFALEVLQIPAPVLRDQAKKLETLPSVAIGSLFFILILALPMFTRSTMVGLILLVIGMTGWTVASVSFARWCHFRAGWIGAMAVMHLAALLLSVGSLLTWSAACIAVGFPVRSRWAFAAAAPLGIGVIVVGGYVYRAARRRLLRLRRDAAVELAKRELERRFAGPWRRRR